MYIFLAPCTIVVYHISLGINTRPRTRQAKRKEKKETTEMKRRYFDSNFTTNELVRTHTSMVRARPTRLLDRGELPPPQKKREAIFPVSEVVEVEIPVAIVSEWTTKRPVRSFFCCVFLDLLGWSPASLRAAPCGGRGMDVGPPGDRVASRDKLTPPSG